MTDIFVRWDRIDSILKTRKCKFNILDDLECNDLKAKTGL